MVVVVFFSHLHSSHCRCSKCHFESLSKRPSVWPSVWQSMFNFLEGMEFIFPSMEFIFPRWNLFSLTGICFPSLEFVFPQWNLFSLKGICFPLTKFISPQWYLCNMRSGMFHPVANWLFFQARISGFIFPGLVIVDKWRVDGQRAYKERVLTLVSRQWQFSLSNINICKQFKLTLRSSTIFFSLWTDRLWLGAAVTSVVICEWHLLALHGHYTHKSCMYMYMQVLSLPSLYILTGTNGVRHVAVCLKWSTSWFHCKRQTLRHTPHFHHHLTDARSQGNFNGHLRQCATCPTSFKGCFSPFILIIKLHLHFSTGANALMR